MAINVRVGGINKENAQAVMKEAIELHQLVTYMGKLGAMPHVAYGELATAYKALADHAAQELAKSPIGPQ